jgi:hypothetical protein
VIGNVGIAEIAEIAEIEKIAGIAGITEIAEIERIDAIEIAEIEGIERMRDGEKPICRYNTIRTYTYCLLVGLPNSIVKKENMCQGRKD